MSLDDELDLSVSLGKQSGHFLQFPLIFSLDKCTMLLRNDKVIADRALRRIFAASLLLRQRIFAASLLLRPYSRNRREASYEAE